MPATTVLVVVPRPVYCVALCSRRKQIAGVAQARIYAGTTARAGQSRFDSASFQRASFRFPPTWAPRAQNRARPMAAGVSLSWKVGLVAPPGAAVVQRLRYCATNNVGTVPRVRPRSLVAFWRHHVQQLKKSPGRFWAGVLAHGGQAVSLLGAFEARVCR